MRRRTVGAEVVSDGVHFRVWAPRRSRVAVVLEQTSREFDLQSEKNGYFSGTIREARSGTDYRLRLDDDRQCFPDPASRFQPRGPHGPSRVIDPNSYQWHDAEWRGATLPGAVIYEMHVGTFTAEGTYRAAAERVSLLADIGISVVELMPVGEFPGKFGWGYDGVDLWAPASLYGQPDDLRTFVDRAHNAGLSVILDVVYNHLGPDGNYLAQFSPDYFTKKYENEWGDALNFDGERSGGVREFFSENAAYWIDEFHFDGLRMDATQAIHDATEPHILKMIVEKSRAAARGRPILIVAENEPQDVKIITAYGADAMWNDDWHHSATVAITGRQEAYYTDYNGSPQEFISMATFGFLYQGQRYEWQKKRRGTPTTGIAAAHFITYLQNHDQIANSTSGDRIHKLTSPARLRALTAVLLLSPQTPMLFQGQEFAASSPFLYFADHKPDLAREVRKGRKEFLAQFPSIAAAHSQLADPSDPRTFESCKLDFRERDRNKAIVALHRDLIRLRRGDATFSSQRTDTLHGAVIGPRAFLLRWLGKPAEDRLLIVNLGPSVDFNPAPEPLLAPPAGLRWETLWSSEDAKYGGAGAVSPEWKDGCWRIPAEAAFVLRSS